MIDEVKDFFSGIIAVKSRVFDNLKTSNQLIREQNVMEAADTCCQMLGYSHKISMPAYDSTG